MSDAPASPGEPARVREAATLALLGKFSTAKVDVYVKLSPAEVEIVRAALEASLGDPTP